MNLYWEILILGVTGVWVAISALSARKANNIVKRQEIETLRKDYSSPQMLYAVRTLWDFYNKHTTTKDFLEEYRSEFDNQKGKINNAELNQKVTVTEGSLDHQRRLVKIFYENLAFIYFEENIPKKYFNYFWKRDTLDIIKKILVPVEEYLPVILNQQIYPDKLSAEEFLPLKLYEEIYKKDNLKENKWQWEQIIGAVVTIAIMAIISFAYYSKLWSANETLQVSSYVSQGLLQWSILMFVGLEIVLAFLYYCKKKT